MDAWLMGDNHGTAFFRIVDQVVSCFIGQDSVELFEEAQEEQ